MKILKKISKIFFEKFLIIFIIFFVVFVFFWKFFIKGFIPLPSDFVVGTYYPWLDYKWGYTVGVPVKNPITTDVVSFTYPMRTLAVELLKRREIPLWNPYILTGTPLLANFQSAPFSLTNIFYFIFDVNTAWSLQIISQHILAMLFTFILLRSWGVGRLASVLGGIIFAFSGFNLIWSQWNAHTLTASFIPLFLYFLNRFLKNASWINCLGLAFCLFLQVISGYPQLILYTFAAFFLFLLFNFKKQKEFFRKTVILAAFCFLGIGLAAFQIFPTLELYKFSQRALEPLERSWAFLPWVKVITFVAPDFFGNHATGNYWGPTDYTTTTGFVGVVSLFFSVFSIRLFREEKKVRYLFSLMFFSLLISFPTPLAKLIFGTHFLGLQAASAHRGLVLFTLSVSLLGAFGMDAFYKTKSLPFKYFLIDLGLLFSFGFFSLFSLLSPKTVSLLGFNPIDSWKLLVSIRNLVFPFLILFSSFLIVFLSKKNFLKANVSKILFAILIVLELFRFGWKFTPFSPRHIVYPKTPVLDYLLSEDEPFRVTTTDVIPINIKMAYRLESLEGYDAIYPILAAKFIAVVNSEFINASPQGRYATVSNLTSHLLDLTNTKYLLALKKDKNGKPFLEGKIPDIFTESERFSIVFSDKTTVVLRNKNSLERAFMVFDWEFIDNENEVLKILIDKNYPFSKKVLLSEPVPLQPSGSKNFAKVEYKKYQTQKSQIFVESEEDGLLFVSDLFFPGWRAYVDKVESKIYRADYAFRAVVVPKGKHIVEFVYKPESFFNGLKFSSASFLLMVFLSVYLYIIGNKKIYKEVYGCKKASRRTT